MEQLVTSKLIPEHLDHLESIGLLVPGAAGRIKALKGRFTGLPTEAVRAFGKFLEGPEGRAYLDPDYKPKTKSVARQALQRLGHLVDEEAVEEILREWGPDLAGSSTAGAVEMLVRRLDRPENRKYLRKGLRAEKPISEWPLRERKARVAIQKFAYFLRVDPDALAKRWAAEVGSLPLNEAFRRVAARLSTPMLARDLTVDGRVLDYDPGSRTFAPMTSAEEQEEMDALLAEIEREKQEARAELQQLREELAEAQALAAVEKARLAELEDRHRARLAGQAK